VLPTQADHTVSFLVHV